MFLTYKYRVKDRSACKALQRHAIGVNQVWNYCVAYQRDVEMRYRAGAKRRRWPTEYDLNGMTAGSSKLLGVHAGSIHEVARFFTQARAAAKGAPRFRASFGNRRARGWVPFRRIDRQTEGNSVLYLGKQYRFFGAKRRPLPTSAKGGCFVEDLLGRWWVCFDVEILDRPTKCTAAIGIDLGLKSILTCSDGTQIEAPRFYRRHEIALAKVQRARKKHQVTRIHARIADCRRDFLHKATTVLTGQNAFIAVGNVKPSKLAKTRMAKSVLDAGWSTFRSMLKYKCRLIGASYHEADERFTTQTCSDCGSIGGPKGIAGLGIRRWDCSFCGASHDRDVNAAKNILIVAQSALRPVEGSRRSAVRKGGNRISAKQVA